MKHSFCPHSCLLFIVAAAVGQFACPTCVPAVLDRPKVKRKKEVIWIVDSGATVHCVNDFSLLTSVCRIVLCFACVVF